MNYCSHCGNAVEARVPKGDDRMRFVCESCDRIHYENPRIIVGCLPRAADGRVLLCRRSIEPCYGLWTLPSGFMENGETLEQGALRETWEESRARCRIVRLYAAFSLAHINHIYFLFLADMLDYQFGPTPESSDVALFAVGEIPWDELAFRPVEFALRRYVSPEFAGFEGVHMGDFRRTGGEPWNGL